LRRVGPLGANAKLSNVPGSLLTVTRPRLDSIDRLRGVVMVLMALDHARDFFSESAFTLDPTDLTRTTTALFLTRWVTHFCAPVFVFLAGVSAHLSLSRGRTKRQLSRFLLSRGVFLILLDPTVIRWSWFWDGNWRFTYGQVIWVLGWSMVILSGLIHLPRWFIAAFGVITIAGHNLWDGIAPERFGTWGFVWNFVHVFGFTRPIPGFTFFVVYPLVPWVGVLAAGYAFGPIMQLEPSARRRWLVGLGVGLTAAFAILRYANVYGDPAPWSQQSNGVFTLLSFLNCQKYPPSLLFLLMTLGPALLALAWFERPAGAIGRWCTVFGRVPMFYYLLHVPLLHLLAVAASVACYGWSAWNISGWNPPEVYGFSLPVVYAAWIAVVATLYLPCRWFAGVKRRRNDWWLSYL